MTRVEELARFVARTGFEDLWEETVAALKLRVLDALGCAIGASGSDLAKALGAHTRDLGGAPHCTLIGGGRTAPDRAAFYNGALVRYLDFNDSFIAPGETCHPSDNLAAVLAAAEYARASGRRLLTALAVAYQVQCTLSEAAPVRARGFDHTTQGAYAVAAGVSKALGLDAERTANAIAMAGTSLNALRVTRTGDLSNWKGLAYPAAAFGATHAAFLASHGVTGPAQVFEGNKGFMEAIAGPFDVDWGEAGLDAVTRTSVKPFNAEIHSQSAVEGILELRRAHRVAPRDVERIELATFEVAFDIIGGGEEGPKLDIQTKEQADHSLPYLLAVALLDGSLLPPQYAPERIAREDVQSLMRRVRVRPDPELTARFPEEHACRITLRLRDGRALEVEKRDFEGHVRRPMSWRRAREKFEELARGHAEGTLLDEIVTSVENLEGIDVTALTGLLAKVSASAPQTRAT